MPFITQDRRDNIESIIDGEVAQPGDLCYVHYKHMVDRWRANPRWTTAHEIYKEVDGRPPEDYDAIIAQQLAWQVFFQLHVMPYELKKRDLNGDI